jgi:hypothetical protein
MTKIELDISKIFEKYFLIIEKEYNVNNIKDIKKKTFNNIKYISHQEFDQIQKKNQKQTIYY